MKIIKKDNYNREDISDVLVAEKVPTCYADNIALFLNKAYSGITSSDFFKVVPDDYKLYHYNPNGDNNNETTTE